MLAGELPWDKPVFECTDFVSWIKNNSYHKSPWCKIENNALSLIRNILTYDPAQRFTIKQIKSSTWFAKTHKNIHHPAINSMSSDSSFLSQPTYFYVNQTNNSTSINGAGNSNNILSPMAAEVEFTDSQLDCECSQSQKPPIFSHHPVAASRPIGLGSEFPGFSFSQPISTDNMILNSQIQVTQNPNSQYASQSQSPFLKLGK